MFDDEEAFQAAIDADRFDWNTRLVFADWLQERDDPRAEGYRALARCQLTPSAFDSSETAFFWKDTTRRQGLDPNGGLYLLPHDWFVAMRLMSTPKGYTNYSTATRRFLEDAAARGFARLPAERRAELLTGLVTA